MFLGVGGKIGVLRSWLVIREGTGVSGEGKGVFRSRLAMREGPVSGVGLLTGCYRLFVDESLPRRSRI